MQVIKEHIKQNQYKRVYLLYGEEGYLKKLYKDKLRTGILGDADGMNCTCFEGKSIQSGEVVEIAQTLPFFAERRLVIIENSGWFKNQSDFADYVREIPDSTCIVFVEKEVDKRNRLYKAVKECGTIVVMDGLDEKNLTLWAASQLARHKKKIAESTVLYLIHKSGTDMEGLSNEIEKLVSYAYGRESITKEDVDAVCTTQITGRIFQMIDAIASKQQNQALLLYHDLLATREKAMTILYLLCRHFNILMQVKELSDNGIKGSAIAAKVGIPPFTVNKYCRQMENFSKELLLKAVRSCTDVEEQVKTGRLADQLGVELLIVEYSLAD